ncbi:hypothetical protein BpHYR1_029222 [Brachionus plicatilis]|uniref:Uncharacterized protein n=1 Tax=Brachionus plicatilis TaxID=10195 RepID=A0A3M7S431_BRAPC|nr:hypothetical protein BpHYR1_029222 [Brachionus plicatilis]
MSDLNQNCVTFEFFPDLEEDDFDLLLLFLENKRQSGGGDISNVNDLAYSSVERRRILKISYENSQVAHRVISKKFLKFKNYHIRSLPGSVSSYKSETQNILPNKLIIQNISVNDNDDESIVEMYAEYLAPENEVIHLQKSSLSPDTFLVTFKDELNKDVVNARFSKKKIFRSKEINLVDSFGTNSFLIFNQKKQFTDFGHLIEKLNSEVANAEDLQDYFMEFNSYSILVQFDSEKLLNDLFDFFKFYLKSINVDLLIEKVFNFALIENFFTQDDSAPKFLHNKKFIEVGVQTDFLSSQESDSKSEESVSDSRKQTRNSITSNYSESSNVSSSNENNLDNLIELNSEACHSKALISVKQLFFNFQDELKKINPKLELISSDGKLFIKNNFPKSNTDWKEKAMAALTSFFENKVLHKVIHVPSEISKNSDLMSKLDAKVQECNKLCPGLHFQFEQQNIEGFGFKKVLQAKSNQIAELISLLVSPEVKDVNDVQYFGNFEIKPDTFAFLALWNLKQIFLDFKNNAKAIGDLQMVDGLKLVIFQTDKHQTDWEKKVKDYLEEFETCQLKKASLEIPANLRNKKNLELIKIEMRQHDKSIISIKYELVPNQIQVFGYTKAVDKFIKVMNKKFKSIQNDLDQIIANKLQMVINKSKAVDYNILQGFDGKYFKEFSDSLSQIQAILAAYYKNEMDNGFKIFCNLEKNDQKDDKKVNKWQLKVMECRKDFFSKFTRQVVQLPYGKTVPNKLNFDPELVIIKWNSNTQADVIGEKNEVERVTKILVEKDRPSDNDVASNFNVSNPDGNTFLINDLKWFQIRILFEEQFFKNLSDNFKDLNVMLDTQLTRICLSGQKKDIDKAKKMAFKILNEILGAEIECDSATLDRMQQNEKIFLGCLKEQKLSCVVDNKSHKDRFIVYSTKLEHIEKFKSVFSELKF